MLAPGISLPAPMPGRLALATDFREFATGSQPAGWTKRGATTAETWLIGADADATGGHVMTIGNFQSNSASISLDAAGAAVTDGEIFAITKTGAAITAPHINAGVAARISGVSDTAYAISLLHQSGVNGGVLSFCLTKPNVALLTAVSFTWAANTRYRMRFRFQGTSLKAKVWPDDGTAEPASYQISLTDSSYASGYVGAGIGAVVNGAQASNIEFFSFVAGSGTAPSPEG